MFWERGAQQKAIFEETPSLRALGSTREQVVDLRQVIDG